MGGEWVIDASVAAKVFFTEEKSDAARKFAETAQRLVAPDLLILEVASVARNHVRRGEATLDYGRRVLTDLESLIDDFTPIGALSVRALELAAEHGFSVYDASYLALAQKTDLKVMTADERLVRRCEAASLQSLVLVL